MAEPSMFNLDVFSVFMCKQCKTILAEGRHACECNETFNVIACLSATMEVEVEEALRYDVSPDLQGCVYCYLKCRTCTAQVGMFITCAVAEVAHLRKLFCFFKNCILCYSMKTKKLLEGNQIYLNVASCVTKLEELNREICDARKRIQTLADKLFLETPSLVEDC